MRSTDTIFAVASGFGRAAICVVRLSGDRTGAVLTALTGGLPAPRLLVLRRLRAPETGEVLDEGLVAWMPGPTSFTGEDQAELHIHGGLATRAAVLRALADREGCRAAEPGEFTRRAFLNGRLDLAEVEGLADLIDAETDRQRRQALRQLGGHLGTLIAGWRDRLVASLALLEAALDFSDEEDVAVDAETTAAAEIGILRDEIATALQDGRRGERLRDGFTVVLAGPPNAGKSTLLNALARREAAIVSPLPGTTRDAIEVRCDLDGLPVVIVDTAGLRESEDAIEREGIARTRARLREADLIFWLMPADGGPEDEPPTGPMIRVRTKCDLGGEAGEAADLAISARTGQGLDHLVDAIRHRAGQALGEGDAVITRERHRRALERAHEALSRALANRRADATELFAEEVRSAVQALGEITGRVDIERVLDHIFSSFCIGK